MITKASITMPILYCFSETRPLDKLNILVRKYCCHFIIWDKIWGHENKICMLLHQSFYVAIACMFVSVSLSPLSFIFECLYIFIESLSVVA